MKIRLFILLLSVPFVWVFGQSSPTEKHIDSLHFAGQHEESIRLRKTFMEAINNQQALERNQLKLKLSEYYGTNTNLKDPNPKSSFKLFSIKTLRKIYFSKLLHGNLLSIMVTASSN